MNPPFFLQRVTMLLFFTLMLMMIPQSAQARQQRLPFTLGVRDSLMIAHSFRGNPAFGPAQGMHGATYTCDVEFSSAELVSPHNWVIDIGKASDILSDVISKYNLKNLDEIFPEGVMTTTEFMAQRIHELLAERVKTECGFKGCVRVKLFESHKAWASFEGDV